MANGKSSGRIHDDPSSPERHDAANYISELSGELAIMARRHGLGTLAYLLDMVKMEADEAQRGARADT